MVLPNSITLFVMIIRELILLSCCIMKYSWLVLYYIFIIIRNTRHFLQDQYGEYHYIKVLICGILIIYMYKIALKYAINGFVQNFKNGMKKIEHYNIRKLQNEQFYAYPQIQNAY